jgi:hypothetical protein
VSTEGKRSSEFRRYRQALTAVYFTVVGAGFLLLTGSVARQLLFPRPPAVELSAPRVSAQDPAPEDLLRCNADLVTLLTQLGSVTRELLDSPPKGELSELASRWEDFSRRWWREYDEVGARCRFNGPAHPRMGVAFDRMAEVYGDLPAIRLKYQSLLVRFNDEQAAELAQMRRALDKSQKALLRRAESDTTP